MKSILLASALALSVMTTGQIAMAEPLKTLTNDQLDNVTAGASDKSRDTSTTFFRGNSNNEVEVQEGESTPPGWKTTDTSTNKGNPDNFNCNDCFTDTKHPNK